MAWTGLTCIPHASWSRSSLSSKRQRHVHSSHSLTQIRLPQSPTMVAAEERVELTAKAQELLGYLRCHKSIFLPGVGFNSTTISLMRKNDTGKCVVPLDEIETNRSHLPGASAIEVVVKKEQEIVEMGWNAAKKAGIKGGEPVEKIVKYDMTTFLRVISYAVGAQCTNYVHENNLLMVKMLYSELGVPSTNVAKGIEAMKKAVIADTKDQSVSGSTSDVFDVVINFLKA